MISMSRILDWWQLVELLEDIIGLHNSFYRAYHTHGELHSITETDTSINGELAGYPYYVVNTDTSTGTPRLNVYKCLIYSI